MSTLAPTMQPASSLRRLVARHPVAAFLVLVYTVTIAFALLRTLGDIRLPFALFLWVSLEHLFDCALPAFLVVAALHGRAGVRDLARRSFRWRVGVRWYLGVLLGLPVATVLCVIAIFGLAPLHTLVAKWLLLRYGPLKACVLVAVAAMLLVVFTRGWLSYRPNPPNA
jgi:hypothetical protein